MKDSVRVEAIEGWVRRKGRAEESFLSRGGVLSGVGGLFWLIGVTKADLNIAASEVASSAAGAVRPRSSPLLAPGGVGGN